jgi:hypothetical protein
MTVTDYAEQRRRDGAIEDAAHAAAIPGFVRQAAVLGADFELPIKTAEQFAVALRAIGGHNRYDVERTITALGPLVPEMAAVTVSHFVVGPALNFKIPYFAHQRICERHTWGGMGVKYSDDERITQAQNLIDLGRALHADEISTTQHPWAESPVWGTPGLNPYRVSLWWD